MSGIWGNFKGELWDYQQEDADLLIRRGGLMLGHKTGLGKTVISLYGASAFGGERALVIGTKSALATWLTEIPQWTEGTPIYLGNKTKDIEEEWKLACQKGRPGIWLMNHDRFKSFMQKYGGKKPFWDIVINDEAHKAKNRTKLLFKALKKVEADHFIFASATFASRGAQDIWSPLHLLDPKTFPSYWKFVNTFCFVDKGSYGTTVEGTRNKEALRELLKDYYVTRKYGDVKKSMPPLRRQPIMVQMSPEQEGLYNKLHKEMLLTEGENLIITSGSLALGTRLRQLALCPQTLDPSFPIGGAVEYLMEEVPAEDQHTVIFSYSKEILRVTRRHLEAQGVKCFMLQGGMEPDEVVEEVRKFKDAKGTMLCTIAFAQSFALDTVGRAYVIGMDPDPINNIQAEGRLRRGNSVLQEGGVLVRYIIVEGTREEDYRDIVKNKLSNIQEFFPGYLG